MSTRRILFYTFLIPALIAFIAIIVVLAVGRGQEKMLKNHITEQSGTTFYLTAPVASGNFNTKVNQSPN